jgi:hypothetical protein
MRFLAIVGIALLSSCLHRTNAGLPRAGMIHTVAFTLAEGEESAAGDLVAELERTLRPIPGVVSLHAGIRGVQYVRPTNQQEFHVLLVVLFLNEKAHDEYEVHPFHKKLVKAWGPRLKAIEILDAVR